MLFVRLFDLCCLNLSVSSSSWCLGRAAVCDCGAPWTFLLPFFCLFPLPLGVLEGLFCDFGTPLAFLLHIFVEAESVIQPLRSVVTLVVFNYH